ncbi:hypothetical protein M432DRAFT_618133 [Thermoascus aurantiacus ATCC 26904]
MHEMKSVSTVTMPLLASLSATQLPDLVYSPAYSAPIFYACTVGTLVCRYEVCTRRPDRTVSYLALVIVTIMCVCVCVCVCSATAAIYPDAGL